MITIRSFFRTIAPDIFTTGSLYLAGFAQARSPHAGLIIPSSSTSGRLVHIRIDRNTSPFWQYQSRKQNISGDMFITSLLRIHDIAISPITEEQLEEAAVSVAVPSNDEFGECLPWVLKVVQKLYDMELLQQVDTNGLVKEFEEFAAGNNSYARRDRFPKVAISQYAT
ncbi:hypothetical protein CPB84DRAFT_1789007 [Gymnopilus junonius]|uniref:Uncharacterized protein n=1 Tax=Gymnopilus junonius TaxID=109634 RepID=A0A9P5NE11_GYMJU|nr:hypothetical protein CPB84DRAFT_1789007 [Gymnopilus junonius]